MNTCCYCFFLASTEKQNPIGEVSAGCIRLSMKTEDASTGRAVSTAASAVAKPSRVELDNLSTKVGKAR